MYNFGPPVTYLWYVHDHLYSPVALIEYPGNVSERYEYDAYGNCYVLEPNFAPDPDGKSDYDNPNYFQGKRLDLLDDGGLELMSWPYRNYSTYLGRWLQAEKLGMIPNDGEINQFLPRNQYADGMNYYEAFASNPLVHTDPAGLSLYDPGEYVAGRGEMMINLFMSTIIRDEWGKIHTLAQIWFRPNARARKCCEEIDFVQIAKLYMKMMISVTHSKPWHIDDKVPLSLSKETGQFVHPWRRGQLRADMQDIPGMAGWRVKLVRLRYLYQGYETCAICTKGCEKGANYGCVPWAHWFFRKKDLVTGRDKWWVLRMAFADFCIGTLADNPNLFVSWRSPDPPSIIFHSIVDTEIP